MTHNIYLKPKRYLCHNKSHFPFLKFEFKNSKLKSQALNQWMSAGIIMELNKRYLLMIPWNKPFVFFKKLSPQS